MPCILVIPKDQSFVTTNYPSEPMLSEAAGRILTPDPLHGRSIVDNAPDILDEASQSGLLPELVHERGLLVAQTLLTVAHDLAAMDGHARLDAEPQFHQPIPLIHFLKKLLAPEIWEVVRHATPEYACEGDAELEVALADIWINISHFIRLANDDSYILKVATDLLSRGAAIQTYDCRIGQDFGIPLHKGNTTMISQERTTIAQFQVNNIEDFSDASIPSPNTIGECSKDLPILSVIMQLGAEKPEGSRVEIKTTWKGMDTPEADDPRPWDTTGDDVARRRHYCIVLYGCTGDTYSCLDRYGPRYQTILQPDTFRNYTRKDVPSLLETVTTLYPILNPSWQQ